MIRVVVFVFVICCHILLVCGCTALDLVAVNLHIQLRLAIPEEGNARTAVGGLFEENEGVWPQLLCVLRGISVEKCSFCKFGLPVKVYTFD